MSWRIGVDEAGRGPVLGSMFVAAVAVPSETPLPAGIDDSKEISPDRREALARAIEDESGCRIGVESLTPADIDTSSASLNELTIAAASRAVRAVLPEEPVAVTCIADACDVDPTRFRRRLAARLPGWLTVEAAHRADATHTIVGAASIIAKSHRESHVTDLAAEYGDVGSGYPSDPRTRRFLRSYVAAHGALPPCARESWQTSSDVLAAFEQESLVSFENR